MKNLAARLSALVLRFSFLRFAVIGTLGVPVDMGGLWVMLNLFHLPFYAGRPMSWLIAATFTWTGNRYFTFGERRARGLAAMSGEWIRFIAANAVGGGINILVSISLRTYAPSPANNPYVAVAIGTLVGLVFNFTLSNRLVFKGPI